MLVPAGFVGRVGQHVPSVVSYSAEAKTLFAAMTTQPSDARKAIIDNLIVGLKADGIWSLLDSLQVYAAHDSQAARVDWVLPSRIATAVNSPTFTTDRGFNGDGATSYVDSGFNFSTSSKYTQDSACFGGWRVTTAGSANLWLGSTTNSREYIRTTASFTDARANSSTSLLVTRSPTGGLHSANRSGAAAVQLYVDGSEIGNSTTASLLILSGNMSIGMGNVSTYNSDQIACVYAGSSLDATKQAALYSRMRTYMTAVGVP